MTKVRAAVMAMALLVAFTACSSSDDNVAKTGTGATSSGSETSTGSSSEAAPTDVTVAVGVNDPKTPNIAVLEYMPSKVTVEVGAPVVFDWTGTIEPHSVTFLAPGQSLPAPGDPSVFGPTPATGPIDGSTFVNSGLQPLGPGAVTPLEVTFAKAGTFEFHCVIHPTMVGTVDVVAKGAAGVDTPATAATRGATEKASYLTEAEAAQAAYAKTAPVSTKNADGTSTWTVQMGTGTAHAQIYEFQPVPAEVKAGDTVTFLNDSGAPHTASFFGKTTPIVDPTDPRTDVAAPGPSPQTLDDSGFFNSGLLPPNAPPGAGPPPAARSFSFVVPKAGTYSYVCILHVPSGMAGQIKAT